MTNQQMSGFENLIGKKVLDDPRAVKALDEVKRAVENYESVLVILALEEGIISGDKEKVN